MQGEKIGGAKIDRKEAEQVVADTLSQSREAAEEKSRMGKVRVLLAGCACGILYLVCVGISYLIRQGSRQGKESLSVWQGGKWYESPVFFYVWAGVLVILCGAAAVYIL